MNVQDGEVVQIDRVLRMRQFRSPRSRQDVIPSRVLSPCPASGRGLRVPSRAGAGRAHGSWHQRHTVLNCIEW